jgi:uncharacterized spore protein YtfJ
MKLDEVMSLAKDSITVKRVYAEPYDKDGVTVIPAAIVGGGGGGGTGHDEKGRENEGGGFGLSGRPAGAFVIKNGYVEWRPAIDPNRIVGIVGLALVAYLVSRPRMLRARAKVARLQSAD